MDTLVNDLKRQIDILLYFVPNLNPDPVYKYIKDVYRHKAFPDWITGHFAIIRPKFFSNEYSEEINEIIKIFSSYKKIHNQCDYELNKDTLIKANKNLAILQQIILKQGSGDIIIFPGQMKSPYENSKIFKAELNSQNSNDFFLGISAIMNIILTDSYTNNKENVMLYCCAGDRVSNSSSCSGEIPCLEIFYDNVILDTSYIMDLNRNHLLPSGVLI